MNKAPLCAALWVEVLRVEMLGVEMLVVEMLAVEMLVLEMLVVEVPTDPLRRALSVPRRRVQLRRRRAPTRPAMPMITAAPGVGIAAVGSMI